jgi:hypothetical protein
MSALLTLTIATQALHAQILKGHSRVRATQATLEAESLVSTITSVPTVPTTATQALHVRIQLGPSHVHVT